MAGVPLQSCTGEANVPAVTVLVRIVWGSGADVPTVLLVLGDMARGIGDRAESLMMAQGLMQVCVSPCLGSPFRLYSYL